MKRRILNLCLFLLLGAIINVAVAWGSVLFVALPNAEAHQAVEFDAKTGINWVVFVIRRPSAVFVFSNREKGLKSNLASAQSPSEITPSLAGLKSPLPGFEESPSEWRLVEARGWPMLSLWCEFRECSSRRPTSSDTIDVCSEGAIEIAGEPNVRILNVTPRVLPLRIWWKGFLLDTSVFAGVLWLIPACYAVVRRRIRAHRSRCTACGYDLRGFRGRISENKLCPECGASASKPS